MNTRTSSAASSAKKRTSKADLWRQYGLERPAKPRYSGLRGILWHLLSLYVRKRDLERWGPICVNCGKEKTDFQGGHFIPTGECGWDGLAFDELNVNSECSFCNFRDKAKLNYARNLDIRYGPGTAQALRERYYDYKHSGKTYKNFTQDEYKAKISHYRALVDN